MKELSRFHTAVALKELPRSLQNKPALSHDAWVQCVHQQNQNITISINGYEVLAYPLITLKKHQVKYTVLKTSGVVTE